MCKLPSKRTNSHFGNYLVKQRTRFSSPETMEICYFSPSQPVGIAQVDVEVTQLSGKISLRLGACYIT